MIKESLNEIMYAEHLNNGLDVIIIPKKGAVNKYAMFATHFGSINYKFKAPGDMDFSVVPDGVAHFLEHKLFEEEDGINALDKLAKIGANANAYTSFNHTAYLFSATENFDEAFDILLNFVQKPYLTVENVEKEKGIIAQEINMYDDDPDWQLFFGFLNCLYKEHAITKDIAGTVDTIKEITPEILYKCYNTFYDPSNMVICVVGDVSPKDILDKVKRLVRDTDEKSKIKRFYGEEPDTINMPKIEKVMPVSIPMFVMGFKDTENKKIIDSGYLDNNYDFVCKHIAVEILLEMLVGKSTKLYEELYSEGFVTREFGVDYSFEENYAYSTISNETKDVDYVIEKIKNRIKELKQVGLDKNEFERIKKMLYGEYVRTFNSVSRIAHTVVSDYFKGINSFDYVDAYKEIDIDFVTSVLKNHFDFDKMCVSVVKNK